MPGDVERRRAAPPTSPAPRRPAGGTRSAAACPARVTVAGSRSPERASTCTPMRRSGSSTRPIGRRDERGVAGEGGGEGVAAGDAHGEAHAGAGIAVVDDAPPARGGRRRRGRATRQAPGAVRVTRRAEGAHGGGGGEHVLALEQALDRGLADGERAEHQRAVRDRLVARRPDRARERSRCAWREAALRHRRSAWSGMALRWSPARGRGADPIA